jgi:hypothetical protein
MPLPVIALAEDRVRQPIVGDVDPLRELETVGTRDVGVMTSKEGPPRDLDRLEARVDGHLEASVEIVEWELRSRRHLSGS